MPPCQCNDQIIYILYIASVMTKLFIYIDIDFQCNDQIICSNTVEEQNVNIYYATLCHMYIQYILWIRITASDCRTSI